jgi:GT2 family glycosyltransferase
VIRTTERADELERLMAGIRAHAPEGTDVVIVADQPSDALAADLEALEAASDIEVIRTGAPFGQAAAINAGTRRASGEVAVVIDPSIELVGNAITPLVRALDDSRIAIAGAFGLNSTDMRRFEPAPPGVVHVVEDALMAFRRGDAEARGPLDERFRRRGSTGTWWSLVLRDEGPDLASRLALAIQVPQVRHPTAESNEPDASRLAKRDFYRVFDRFGARRDLLTSAPMSAEP